ncbi:hypothetical protein E2562_034770 [Oryza meyeriana var. granulata]|uniref:Uncharacterized protein n=1 Tax=Oryza meyeriana var. granulata TaxID=110450 RepID=A0A6G1CLR3_9ORYZ|nr:hypothetical protein E2562_034770 [Oryza meyeriana var. granulata]
MAYTSTAAQCMRQRKNCKLPYHITGPVSSHPNWRPCRHAEAAPADYRHQGPNPREMQAARLITGHGDAGR